MSASGSPRLQTIQRFAAFVTHLFNGTDRPTAEVVLDFGENYHLIVSALRSNPRYRRYLIGEQLLGDSVDLDLHAERFFAMVMDKPVGTGRDPATSSVVKLLAALLGRSVSPACRELQPVRREAMAMPATPFDPALRHVATALAAAARETDGTAAIALEGPGGAYPVPPAMSLWRTLITAPRHVRRLEAGAGLEALQSRVLEVFRSANRHFYEFLSMGLSPFAWTEAIGVNQAGEIGRLCRRAQQISGEKRYGDIPPAAWQEAWTEKPVPGFATLAQFLDSEIGKTLRGLLKAENVIPIEDTETWLAAEPAAAAMNRDDFAVLAGEAVERGFIEPYERDVLIGLYDGRSIADFTSEPAFAAHFGRQGAKIERSLENLRGRLAAFAAEGRE
jgi:hypothetical protein